MRGREEGRRPKAGRLLATLQSGQGCAADRSLPEAGDHYGLSECSFNG